MSVAGGCARVLALGAVLSAPWAGLALAQGAEPDGAEAPADPAATPPAAGGWGAPAAPAVYRELPAPLPAATPAALAPAPRRRGVRIGPWELEGRLQLTSGSGLGSSLALGYHLLPRLVALASVVLFWDVADAGAAGVSGVESSWGWRGGLELKGYLAQPRSRRLLPVLSLSFGFGYSTLHLDSGDSLAVYTLEATPALGASVFLAPRVGVLLDTGLALSRVWSSTRYSWQGASRTRLTLVLRW